MGLEFVRNPDCILLSLTVSISTILERNEKKMHASLYFLFLKDFDFVYSFSAY